MGCQLADELATGFGLRTSASQSCVDVFAEGYAFRLFLSSDRLGSLLSQLTRIGSVLAELHTVGGGGLCCCHVPCITIRKCLPRLHNLSNINCPRLSTAQPLLCTGYGWL